MTTTTTTTTTTTIAVSTLAPLALQFNSAEQTMRDLEALLAEATKVTHERHADLLAAITAAKDEGLSQAAIAEVIKAGGAAFGKDLVGHALRAQALFVADDEADAAGLYTLRTAITNAATNWGVRLGTIDAAIKGLSVAKAIDAVLALKDAPAPVVEGEGETDEDDAEGEGEGEGEGDEVVNDAARLVAIANILKGVERDGSADPEAVLAIIKSLQALVA